MTYQYEAGSLHSEILLKREDNIMGRRRQSFFEDLVEIATLLPWWIGVIAALVTYLVLHYFAVQPVPDTMTDLKHMGAFVSGQLWKTIAIFMQYIMPGAFLLGAAISAYKQRGKGSPVGQPDNPTAPRKNSVSRIAAASNDAVPACPLCKSAMVMRVAKRGGNAGGAFWGCSDYPRCRGTTPA
jgi:hypothetical protein